MSFLAKAYVYTPTFDVRRINYPVRYRIQAVDIYESESILSDFAKTEAKFSDAMIGPDNPILENEPKVPKDFSLKQNYPNPFNPSTNIQYDLPLDNFVSIKIFNALRKEVMTLVDEFKNAGSYIISFNGTNLPSGVYYYKIKAGNFVSTKRMILIK